MIKPLGYLEHTASFIVYMTVGIDMSISQLFSRPACVRLFAVRNVLILSAIVVFNLFCNNNMFIYPTLIIEKGINNNRYRLLFIS